MNNINLQELITLAQGVTLSGLPLMEGKEKIEVTGALLGTTLTVDDYGFLDGEEGQYVAISLQEYPNNFIYGSSVVTDAFKKLDEKLTEEQRAMLLDNGLTFTLSQVTSKNKRKYTKINFFPSN